MSKKKGVWKVILDFLEDFQKKRKLKFDRDINTYDDEFFDFLKLAFQCEGTSSKKLMKTILNVKRTVSQYVWFNMPELWDWSAIRILHYQYEKPWQAPHPRAAELAPLIALWEAFAGDGPVPDIAALPGPQG